MIPRLLANDPQIMGTAFVKAQCKVVVVSVRSLFQASTSQAPEEKDKEHWGGLCW